jgi:hypothetical protein
MGALVEKPARTLGEDSPNAPRLYLHLRMLPKWIEFSLTHRIMARV